MNGQTAVASNLPIKKDKPKERLYTIKEYLAMEENSLTNHEFDNGKLIPMAGGTPTHSLIKARVVHVLIQKIDEAKKNHLVFNSDIRIYLPVFNRGVMPDAAVVVGKANFSIEHPVGLLLNPTLIVEVLSDGNESYDRGEKFVRYRTLPSLEEYVLVSQNTPRVETFVKQNGKWFINEAAEGLDAEVELVTLGVKIPLKEIYWNVSFEEEKPKKRTKKK
jgi:Uma2 family endonuclease